MGSSFELFCLLLRMIAFKLVDRVAGRQPVDMAVLRLALIAAAFKASGAANVRRGVG